jgi:hypothetical protein
MSVFVTNDRTQPWQGQVRWTLETLAGEVLNGGAQEITAAGLGATPVFSSDFAGQIGPGEARR